MTTTMSTLRHHPIPASHFNKRTLSALTKKGVAIVSMTALPDEKGSFLNSETGYQLSTGQLLTYLAVLALVS